MHKYHIMQKVNGKKYWLKSFGQYGEMHFGEWTSKLPHAMKFDTGKAAQEYLDKFFSKRPEIDVDKQFDVYGNYNYGLG